MYRDVDYKTEYIAIEIETLCCSDKRKRKFHTMQSPKFDLSEVVVWFDLIQFFGEILKIYFGLIVIFNFSG